MIERDAQGNPRAVWREGSRADHFAHAEAYCLLAQELTPPRIGRPDLMGEGMTRVSPWNMGMPNVPRPW
jgi:hypothetical protein